MPTDYEQQTIIMTPALLEQLTNYTKFFIRMQRDQLERAPHTHTHPLDPQIALLKVELQRAEQVLQTVESARNRLLYFYKWNFEQLAQVLKTCRQQMEVDDIEKVYTLKVVLINLMHMLKTDNPFFSKDKFIQFINER